MVPVIRGDVAECLGRCWLGDATHPGSALIEVFTTYDYSHLGDALGHVMLACPSLSRGCLWRLHPSSRAVTCATIECLGHRRIKPL